jgi:hypothetical protein
MSGSQSTILTTKDMSLLVGTTSVIAIPANELSYIGPLRLLRIYNVSSTATIWASRAGLAVVGGPGSFPIAPLTYELWQAPGPVPANQLQLISTAASTPVTIEVG